MAQHWRRKRITPAGRPKGGHSQARRRDGQSGSEGLRMEDSRFEDQCAVGDGGEAEPPRERGLPRGRPADPAPAPGEIRVLSQHPDPPPVGTQQARGHPQKRRLSGAVGAGELHDLARLYLQAGLP